MEDLMKRPPLPTINLRDLGFVGDVSPKALTEIRELERRSDLVLKTSHLFLFR